MPKCTLCGKNYELPRGLTLVLLDGRALHFCSGKCRKNHKIRQSKNLKWITKRKETKKDEIDGLKKEAEEQKEKTQEAKETEKEIAVEAKEMQETKQAKEEEKKDN